MKISFRLPLSLLHIYYIATLGKRKRTDGQTDRHPDLEIGNGYWDGQFVLGFGILDWEWGPGLGIGIGDLELGLGIGIID